jgi:TfoX/Sxy family transcriptional regulator of competence genes
VARARAMPKWQPAPEPLVRQFLDAIAAIADAQVRKMFGYPAAFRSGNLFAGLFQDALIVRLPPADRAALLAHAGARPFEPMPGRPMREYVVVPPKIVRTRAALRRWLAKASAYAGSLPPKPPRARKRSPGR